MELSDSVSKMRGVGAERLKKLNGLGIFTINDMIRHYPRGYKDLSVVSPIGGVVPGEVFAVRAVIARSPENLSYSGITVTRVSVTDGTGEMDMVWFNQPYLKNTFSRFPKKTEFVFSGEVLRKMNRLQIESPDYEVVSDKELLSAGRIVPVYPSAAGLSQKQIRALIHSALESVSDKITEVLPEVVRERYELCPRRYAIQNIHFPENNAAYFKARGTLVFSELFQMQTNLFRIKGELKRIKGAVFSDTDASAFFSRLPFRFTSAQERAFGEIVSDLRSGTMMNRLVQGDVGSGKTAVAMACAYIAAKNGFQTALMAPTETLAWQHFISFSDVLEPLGIRMEFLAGSTPKRAKDKVKSELASGGVQIIIGTHALIQENVVFNRLGLVICDEQHRFGVRQRASLAGKGESPHTLVMTATPIPRTLALILYGDLDISVIDELPPGRQPIDTYSVGTSYRKRIFDFIKRQVEAGRQAYVVCPVIEENETDMVSVTEYYDMLRETAGVRTAILHGRMKQAEKNTVMSAFSKGEIDALVSTTVIEVGINVPNATVMLIENAERFGLAQLHQLRGRVGRGSEQSYCILVTNSKADVTKRRMNAMTSTNDGFVLSDLDLTIRGPGEFFGTKQHGLPEMRIANLYSDIGILKRAQEAAEWAFENGLIDRDPGIAEGAELICTI